VGVCADGRFGRWNVRGLVLHLSDCVERGRKVDERARLLCEYLGDAPAREVCEQVAGV